MVLLIILLCLALHAHMCLTNKTILVGDVGGTNIRFSLLYYSRGNSEYSSFFQKKYLVKEYDTFQSAVLTFLADSNLPYDNYPAVAVFAFAGPIQNDSVSLTNVKKWKKIQASHLEKVLSTKVIILNDFVAAAYGVSEMPADNFIPVNGKHIDKNKLIGVFGPGTGLGNALIHPGVHGGQSFVLNSEGGHADMSLIDDETLQFAVFLKQHGHHASMSVQKSISGRTIPLIFKFYANKMNITLEGQLSSESIFENALAQNPEQIYKNTLQLYLKFYRSAIGNFIVHHMCSGGVYLIGSITKALSQKLRGNILLEWIQRHPQLNVKMDDIPIVVSKEEDLGLFGSYIIAKRYLDSL